MIHVEATGHVLTQPPTLDISGGEGNLHDVEEVHIYAFDPETQTSIMGWFRAADLENAISAARRRQHVDYDPIQLSEN